MKSKDFISSNFVIALPNATDPKVYLAIDSVKLASLSFLLYNPFSFKGKVFKWVFRTLCVHMNWLAKMVLPKVEFEESVFIQYLNNELKKEFTSSVYIATAKDKIVIQLIADKAIYGYLKFPISPIGITRLKNEQLAFETLSKKGLVSNVLFYGNYNSIPFIILKNLEGIIGQISNDEKRVVLDSFKKEHQFLLKNHPRINSLQKKLQIAQFDDLTITLQTLIETSKIHYKEVFEHGDFAPWNLIRTKKGLVPFDFEYFTENGLEHLDDIKFHYQVEFLLKGKRGTNLINAISEKVEVAEFHIIFPVFLVKEILIKNETSEDFIYEFDLLKSHYMLHSST